MALETGSVSRMLLMITLFIQIFNFVTAVLKNSLYFLATNTLF